jgi:DUF1009 family protein
MREAGIEVAVLEAGNTLILERESVLAKANSWGIHLIGVRP